MKVFRSAPNGGCFVCRELGTVVYTPSGMNVSREYLLCAKHNLSVGDPYGERRPLEPVLDPEGADW